MKTLIMGLLTVVLSLSVFFPLAHADVIDPGNPYRKPNRPKPIPVTRVIKMRAPDFTLTKVEEQENTYRLQATLPGPCEWEYIVYTEIEGATKKVAGGGTYAVQDVETASDSKEIILQLPEGKEKARIMVDVEFTLYRFIETNFGPKVYETDNRSLAVEHMYELESVDGKQVLKKL